MSARTPFRLTSLAFRPRQPCRLAQAQGVRRYADDANKGRMHEGKHSGDENMRNIPHVSEEAAAQKSAQGEQGPELEQGSKVSEVVKGDKEAQANLPKVMQDAMKKDKDMANKPAQTRPYSTSSRAAPTSRRNFSTSTYRSEELARTQSALGELEGRGLFRQSSAALQTQDMAEAQSGLQAMEDFMEEEGLEEDQGHKFGLPTLPLPPGSNLKKRYEPIVEQVTKLLMKDGKLSVAQRNMNTILTHLRTSPAPRPDAKHPLIPGSPPHSMLPLNPTLYLTLAIDSVAPIFRIRSQRGAAGGGVALQLPVPLRQRQRRRTAVQWMLDAADKKKGGTSSFAKRFAEEIVAVAEGRSTCWTRRDALHAMGIRARANLTVMAARQRR